MSEAPRPTNRLLRWANVAVRGAHQIAVVGLGAALLGAPLSLPAYGAAVVATGAVLLAIEWAEKPGLFCEARGASMLIKLAVVAWLAMGSAAALPLFWSVLAWSAFFAHAPGAFRHARIFCGGKIP